MTRTPELLPRKDRDRGLLPMILVSAFAHFLIVAVILYLPRRADRAVDVPLSYTVDLVSAASIGGTNLPPIGNAAKAAAAGTDPPVPLPAPAAVPLAPAEVAAPSAIPAPQPGEEAPAAIAPEPVSPPVVAADEPAQAARDEPTGPAVPPPDAKVPAEGGPAPVMAKARVIDPDDAPAKEVKERAKAQTSKPSPAKAMDEHRSAASVIPPALAKATLHPKVNSQAKASPPPAAAETRRVARSPERPNAAAPAPPTAPPVAEDPPSPALAGLSPEKLAQLRDRAIAAAIERHSADAPKTEDNDGREGGGPPVAVARGPLSIGPGEGAGGIQQSAEYILYYTGLRDRMKKNWAWAGTNPALQAVVHFNVAPTGEISNVYTVKSSGDPAFDRSVERAVRGSSPLPPPPERHRADFAEVELTFVASDLQP